MICSFLSFLIYMAVDIERNRCLRVTQLFADTDDVCAIGDADRGHCMPKCVRMQILDSILLSKSCKIRCGSLRIQNLTVFSCKAVPFSRVSLCQQISCLFPLPFSHYRQNRKERGMTQEELAEKLDLSINYVGALERAEKNLTVTNLINIANVLGVTADMLLCDEIRTGYKIKSSMITEKIEKLSPSDRDKIMQMLNIMLGEK